jgi:hypothetical protein
VVSSCLHLAEPITHFNPRNGTRAGIDGNKQEKRNRNTHNGRLAQKGTSFVIVERQHEAGVLDERTEHSVTLEKHKHNKKLETATDLWEPRQPCNDIWFLIYTSHTAAEQPALKQPSTVALTIDGGHPAVWTHLS